MQEKSDFLFIGHADDIKFLGCESTFFRSLVNLFRNGDNFFGNQVNLFRNGDNLNKQHIYNSGVL